MTDHRQVDSFERDHVDAVDVGSTGVAIVTGSNVGIVTGKDRTEFEHDTPVDDIAYGERVVVLADGQLVAYSMESDRLWEQSHSEAYALTSMPGGRKIGLLEPGQVRVFDAYSGQQAAVLDRESTEQSLDDQLVGTEAGFGIASWTFLTGISTEDGVSFDRNFDSVVRSVGWCGDIFVTALQDDRVIGVDVATGAIRWDTEMPVKHVAPAGREHVFVTTTDGVRAIKPDGTIEPASGIGEGRIYEAIDGSVLCSIRAGKVTTHVPVHDRLDVDIATNTVGVGGSIEVVAENETKVHHRGTLELTLEDGMLSPGQRPIDLEPGASTLIDFPVASVVAEGDSTVMVREGDTVLSQSSVTLKDAADTTLGVEASLQPLAIKDGIVHLEVVVKNKGDLAVDRVVIFETDEEVTELDPGAQWAATVSRQFDPERTTTVGVEAGRGARRGEFAPTCTLPDAPTIELTEDGDVLRAQIEAPEGVTVTDQLVLEVPGFGRVRTPVEIDDDLLLIVPIIEEGVARVRLADLDVASQTDVAGRSAFAGNSPTPMARTDRSHPTVSAESDRSPSGDGSLSDNRDGEALATGTSNVASSNVDASRSVEEANTSLGHLVIDRIDIHAPGVSSVSVTGGEALTQLDPPTESVTVERCAALLSAEGGQLSAIEIRANGSTAERLPAVELSPASDGVDVLLATDPSDGRVLGEIINQTAQPIRVRRIEIDGQGVSPIPENPVKAGERVDIDSWVPNPLSGSGGLLPGLVELEGPEAPVARLDIAVVAQSVGSESPTAPSLEAGIGASTEAAGDYGTVVVVFENETDNALKEVSVLASGDAINENLYSGAKRGTLPPDDRIEHTIDLKTDAGQVAINVDLTYTDQGSEESFQYQVSGPAITDESDWTDEHLADWSIQQRSGGGGTSIEFPPVVSGPFERR